MVDLKNGFMIMWGSFDSDSPSIFMSHLTRWRDKGDKGEYRSDLVYNSYNTISSNLNLSTIALNKTLIKDQIYIFLYCLLIG